MTTEQQDAAGPRKKLLDRAKSCGTAQKSCGAVQKMLRSRAKNAAGPHKHCRMI
jgi:hypothetical protein